MMMKALYRFLFGTLRGRLIMGVAAVHAVMMALFIGDLTVRQRAMLLDRQTEEATALSQALATSAAGWIAAVDISGLQEIVATQSKYPEMLFAILTDKEGRVLAATDESRQGLFVLDLPRETRQAVLSRTHALVDVATPATLGGRHVGWARVGIGQEVAARKLADITRNGIAYSLAAILIGSIIAWFMGRRITRRLYAVQETIAAVRSGNHLARSAIAGADEAVAMAREFNSMLDALAEREADLRTSEERYRSLIRKVQAAIVLHDGQGRILDSNPLAQELLGFSADQLLGKALVDPEWHFVREDGSVLPVAEYPVSLVLSTRRPLRSYMTGISRPGRDGVAWVLVNAEPECDAFGTLALVIVSFVDVTGRKQAEEALRESEAKYRRLVDTANEGIWALDPNLITTFVNARTAEMLGQSAEEMIGRSLEDFLFPDDVADQLRKRDNRRQGLSEHYERRFRHRDGRTVWAFLSAAPILDDQRQFRGSFAMVTDITARKRAERERLAHLWFFECMDRINRSIHGTNDLESAMGDVLDTVLSVLECDRAWLVYPCDPATTTFQVPMERSRPEYGGTSAVGLEVPVVPEIAELLQTLRAENGPVKFGPGSDRPLPPDMAKRFSIRSQIAMAIYPKTDRPYAFGLHQCSHPRVWTVDDERLFQEIGRRLGDALASLLSYRHLQESEERYRMAQAMGHVGNWEYNLRTSQFWGSAEAKRIYGFDPELTTFSAADVEDCIPERARVHQALVDLVETGRPYNLEFAILPRGSSVPTIVASIAELQRDDHGDALKVVGVIQDITARKRTEEELARYREGLEDLVRERTSELEVARNKVQQYLDIAGVILIAIDADRRVTLINQKGCEVLGGTAGEIIGKDWFETFVPASIRQGVTETFGRLLAGETELVEYFENRVLTRGGGERLIAWHNALLRDRTGSIVGTLSSGEDITARKRAEEALVAVNKELEAFAYSVSHDLRAPLRHIGGFLELLQERTAATLDEKSQHYMATISESATRMGMLIDDLLSFSRMGRQKMSQMQVDLGALLQEVIRECEPETRGRAIRWRIAELPVVTGDRAMLRIVLINLISNALKFTCPRSQAEIEIGQTPSREPEVIIFVRDNGVGFDMNYAGKLFGVFQRLHRADEFEGTGIGLANVRRIIGRHGGRVWAEGQVNQGATFHFSLPQPIQGV